jgi:prepilin peptidase CpaA
VFLVVLVAALTATIVDVRTRRIPNALTFGIAAFGFAMAGTGASGLSFGSALAGCALGLALMLPGHVYGGTGAGDVKFLAALGAVVGPGRIVATFLYGAIAGGVIAIGFACARGRLGRTIRGASRIAAGDPGARSEASAAGVNNRFPYAPAIAAGSLLAVLGF